MLSITKNAQKYFIKLLNKQHKNTQIRIFITDLGTPNAKCGVCYCPPETIHINDIVIKFNSFSIYIEKSIVPFVKDTYIDIISNTFGTKLILKSPNLYDQNHNYEVDHNSHNNIDLLEKRVTHVLESYINPQLSIHGGKVSLSHITKDLLAVLQFHGGCNGCAMASNTIKAGIEITLKKLFPELKGVLDNTQHQRGTHSYY